MTLVNRKTNKQPKPKKIKGGEQTNSSENENIKSEESNTKSRSFLSRCCGWFKYFILLLLIPPFLNYAALGQEQRFLQQQDTLYDVGNGQKLSFICVGKGKPTVLLEAPTGTSSDIWSLVVSSLSKTTKVCVYDRAGLGFSERPQRNRTEEGPEDEFQNKEPSKKKGRQRWEPFTVEKMVDDLHFLINYSSQQVEKPFIYVGSELGALVARFYAQIYETDVSDLVLVDPLVESLFQEDDGIWTKHWFNHIIPSYQTMQLAAATGITRLALMAGIIKPPLADGDVPDEVMMKQKHLLCHPRHLSSVVDEFHFINDSISQMQTVFLMKSFPSNVSITVITGNYYDEQLPSSLNKAWAKSQQNLISKLHPSSNHIVVNDADRKMIYKKPEAIVDPIKKLVKLRRNNGVKAQSS